MAIAREGSPVTSGPARLRNTLVGPGRGSYTRVNSARRSNRRVAADLGDTMGGAGRRRGTDRRRVCRASLARRGGDVDLYRDANHLTLRCRHEHGRHTGQFGGCSRVCHGRGFSQVKTSGGREGGCRRARVGRLGVPTERPGLEGSWLGA